MVKECAVKLNNDAVTVVNFDGIEVQFPAINKDDKTVFVSFENGKYAIVGKDYKENSAGKSNKSGANKKTTKEESVEITEDTVTVEETPDA